ncbi:DUF2075 domain-containing protein [Gordonia defluvii]|uniref:DUF2075 domain-containing protein n=1 Tax=Gordonia defluvii TaxID=283718 RepID=UPI0031DE5D0C
MTLLRTTAADPRFDQPESLVEQLLEQMLFATGSRAGPAEQKSWLRSLPALAAELREADLCDVEMLLEYRMPLTSQRADVVLAGVHPDSGAPSYVVVELKQWSAAYAFEEDSNLVDVPGMPGGPKLNPILQVRGYCDYISDFARALEDQPDALAGVAYLHNAVDPALVADLRRVPITTSGQLFTAAERDGFQRFLRSRLASSSGRASADLLLKSHAAPSRQLLKVAADEVKNRSQFHLLGNQQLAVDLVLHQVEQARVSDSKRVIVVSGGPGSGKSVIALELLGELARQGRSVIHATGSRSFTQTLRKVAGHRAPRVQKLFKYFNQFMAAEVNGLDVLIMDEAHRIRETSVDRYTRAEFRTGRPQIDELIDAARVPVFLLDEHQVVRPGEMGSLSQITGFAKSRGLEVIHVPIDAQFRCGGSEEYLQWVQRLLGLDETNGPVTWSPDPAFAIEIVDSPWELERRLEEKMADGYSARMTAGYCWPWSDPTKDGELIADVSVGDWARPWNVKGDRRVGDAPPAAMWATVEGGFGQVGCIYTAQGFEYDWNGVIIGPDLLWRDDGFITDRGANRDPDFKNSTKVSDLRFDRLVRNVYKVLLTRGMVGTVIYATDPETRDALHRLVGRDES